MSDLKMVRYSEGDVILREGELSNVMYKIIKGHAEIYIDYGLKQETLLKIIGNNACFGEYSFLLKKPAIYTVIAHEDILVLKISEDNLGDFIMNNHQNVIDIMKNMANNMYMLRFQVDMLLNELEASGKSDEANVKNAKKISRTFGMYRSIEEAMSSIEKINFFNNTDDGGSKNGRTLY